MDWILREEEVAESFSRYSPNLHLPTFSLWWKIRSTKLSFFFTKFDTATQNIGFFFNAVKSHIHAMNNGEIAKVDDFLYLGDYTNFSRDINTWIGKSWGTLKTRKNLELSHYYRKESYDFKIYYRVHIAIRLWILGSDKCCVKKVNGTYICVLRRVKNVSWRDRLSTA